MIEMSSRGGVLGTRQALTSGFDAEIANVVSPYARIELFCSDRCNENKEEVRNHYK